MQNVSHLPPEWAPHARCWLALPASPELWGDNLAGARAEFVAFCRLLAAHEPLSVLVPDAASGAALLGEVGSPSMVTCVEDYGDIWLRDTGPLFLLPGGGDRPGGGEASAAAVAGACAGDGDGAPVAACFRFNGWGERYLFAPDQQLAARIAARAGWASAQHALVLEGGSVEVDGTGLILTSRQCLLNPNRNPHLSQREIEAALCVVLGGNEVLWLGEGLLCDHTDGHIDTIARFMGPRHIVYMRPDGHDDPNAAILMALESELRALQPRQGPPLRLSPIPSPGAVMGQDAEPMPASYLNFYLGNDVAIMPTYDSPHDGAAAAALAALCPERAFYASPARSILTGGGAFHCMSQQEPRRAPDASPSAMAAEERSLTAEPHSRRRAAVGGTSPGGERKPR